MTRKMLGLAVSDKEAKEHFSDEDYRALENGEAHTLLPEEIAEAADGQFSNDTEAVDFLKVNGGGWTFDEELCSYYTSPEPQDSVSESRLDAYADFATRL